MCHTPYIQGACYPGLKCPPAVGKKQFHRHSSSPGMHLGAQVQNPLSKFVDKDLDRIIVCSQATYVKVQLYLDYRGTANLEIFGLEERIKVSFSSNTVLTSVGNESIMEISEALK